MERKRNRGCRRLDNLCGLTEAQKTERDATMRAWLNLRKIERVARASGLLPSQGPLTDIFAAES
jgi:hypothetical protein